MAHQAKPLVILGEHLLLGLDIIAFIGQGFNKYEKAGWSDEKVNRALKLLGWPVKDGEVDWTVLNELSNALSLLIALFFANRAALAPLSLDVRPLLQELWQVPPLSFDDMKKMIEAFERLLLVIASGELTEADCKSTGTDCKS